MIQNTRVHATPSVATTTPVLISNVPAGSARLSVPGFGSRATLQPDPTSACASATDDDKLATTWLHCFDCPPGEPQRTRASKVCARRSMALPVTSRLPTRSCARKTKHWWSCLVTSSRVLSTSLAKRRSPPSQQPPRRRQQPRLPLLHARAELAHRSVARKVTITLGEQSC